MFDRESGQTIAESVAESANSVVESADSVVESADSTTDSAADPVKKRPVGTGLYRIMKYKHTELPLRVLDRNHCSKSFVKIKK